MRNLPDFTSNEYKVWLFSLLTKFTNLCLFSDIFSTNCCVFPVHIIFLGYQVLEISSFVHSAVSLHKESLESL